MFMKDGVYNPPRGSSPVAPGGPTCPSRTEFPSFQGNNIMRLFDDKVAISQEYAYDGVTNGERWKKKVRGYWLAKCPDVQPLLDWAESKKDQVITEEEFLDKVKSNFWMMEEDVKRVNGLIWGFLNSCLKGDAQSIFELAEELHGVEAWWLVVQYIHRGSDVRLATLRRAVNQPPMITKLEDVSAGLLGSRT